MMCLGCQIANQEIETHVVYEDEWISCILDIHPLNEGHTLILPKAHYKELDELDVMTHKAIMQASRLISSILKKIYQPDGISIMQNGGLFNDLDHYHMHVFPRYKDDGFAWVEPIHNYENELSLVREKMSKEIKKS